MNVKIFLKNYTTIKSFLNDGNEPVNLIRCHTFDYLPAADANYICGAPIFSIFLKKNNEEIVKYNIITIAAYY